MKQYFKNILRLSVLTACVASPQILLAELTASVDVRELTTDETINFTLSTTTGSGNPDFSVLQNDFEILGQSTFSQTQSHNGKIIQNLSWRLQLLPKREGQLVIPALAVSGENSEPITLTVTSPRVVTGDDFGDFHVISSVDNESPYVQSQVIYTIQVYHAKNFLDGSLSSPNVAGVTLEQLGDDRVFQENRNGRQYRVLERKFALFAQNSGALTLPAVVLNANVAANARSQGFFAPRQPVRRRGNELTLNVLPRPTTANANWWLPARQVQLDARWDESNQEYFVGESFTRTVSLLADGVDSTQLPEISPAPSAAYRIYADKPELQKQATREGLRSRRTEKWAIVPQKDGELVLPAIEIPWFNTRTGQAELAVLPAATIQVQPARNAVTGEIKQPSTANTTPGNANPGTSNPDTGNPGTVKSEEAEHQATSELVGSAISPSQVGADTASTAPAIATNQWKWLAITAMTGWALTIVAVFWARQSDRARSRPSSAPDTARELLDELVHTEKAQDPQSFAAALVRWGRGHWTEDPPASLVALAERVDSTELAADIRSLDASLYSAQTGAAENSVNFSGILEQIRRLCDTRSRRSPERFNAEIEKDALPKL